jgi:hypothetical protein
MTDLVIAPPNVAPGIVAPAAVLLATDRAAVRLSTVRVFPTGAMLEFDIWIEAGHPGLAAGPADLRRRVRSGPDELRLAARIGAGAFVEAGPPRQGGRFTIWQSGGSTAQLRVFGWLAPLPAEDVTVRLSWPLVAAEPGEVQLAAAELARAAAAAIQLWPPAPDGVRFLP